MRASTRPILNARATDARARVTRRRDGTDPIRYDMEATLARHDDEETHREEETHAHGPTPIVALEVRTIRFDSIRFDSMTMTIDERLIR